MKKLLKIFILLTSFMVKAEQYVYPVVDLDEGKQLLLLYQKSLHDIELWVWDTFSKTAQKGLLSFYSPANLRALPGQDGFSFIDQGRIRIKKFNRRSPKAIDIYHPISSISSMNWIDEDSFYFVAREGDFYNVFQSDIQGNVTRITKEFQVDFLYPQKVGGQLFCIKRDFDRNFDIVYMNWDAQEYYKSEDLVNYTTAIQANQPICFLHMISNEEGFYLEYSGFRASNSETYNFNCYHFYNQGESWEKKYLFQFKVPVDVISGNSNSRVYESLEPFLPNYTCKDLVYFVSFDTNRKSFGMYSYDVIEGKTSTVYKPMQKSLSQNEYFVPFKTQDKMFCGMIIKNMKSSDFLIQNILTGSVTFDLPYFDV